VSDSDREGSIVNVPWPTGAVAQLERRNLFRSYEVQTLSPSTLFQTRTVCDLPPTYTVTLCSNDVTVVICVDLEGKRAHDNL
jgi:hypothetical protein